MEDITAQPDDQALVLISGGIDSLVVAEVCRSAGKLAGCIFVDYGHPAQIPEGWKAFAYCGARGIPLKVVHAFGMDLGDMASEAGARVVPGRNLVLLALAANVARSMGATCIAIGANQADQADYTDCRREFFDLAGLAIGMQISTPLIHWGKAGIVELAETFGLKRSDAWSCYVGGPTECGECPSCLSAAAAWENLCD